MLLKYSEEIRDSVHSYIKITPIERELIDTKIFQRLKRIAQTPGAKFVYPGSEHSRFSHSIGVMYLAGMLAEKLLIRERLGDDFNLVRTLKDICSRGKEAFPEVNDKVGKLHNIARKVQIVRIAALLHDIGQPPFSHTLEYILEKYRKIKHEDVSRDLIMGDKEIAEIFTNYGGKGKPHSDLEYYHITREDLINLLVE